MLDLSAQSKKFMTVILPNKMEIFVLSPTKRQLSALLAIQNNPDIDGFYQMAADLLSNNLQKRIFSGVELDDWSIEDVTNFFAEYMRFVKGVKNNPNSQFPITPEAREIGNISQSQVGEKSLFLSIPD